MLSLWHCLSRRGCVSVQRVSPESGVLWSDASLRAGHPLCKAPHTACLAQPAAGGGSHRDSDCLLVLCGLTEHRRVETQGFTSSGSAWSSLGLAAVAQIRWDPLGTGGDGMCD